MPDVVVVRLKTHGQRLELAVHRHRMDAYVAAGRDVAPTDKELSAMLVDRTIFSNAHKRQRATRQSVMTAFEKDIQSVDGHLNEDALFSRARLTVLQFGELVEDDTVRHKRRADESESASKLHGMIGDRLVSVFTGEALPDEELDQLLSDAKENQVLPANVWRPVEGSSLVEWATYAAYALADANKASLRRKTLCAELAIRADAKPTAQLLQRMCRDHSELVVLKAKREYQAPPKNEQKKAEEEGEGDEDEAEEQDNEEDAEVEDEEDAEPQVPTFIYTVLYDSALLDLPGCRMVVEPGQALENALAGHLSHQNKAKTAGGGKSGNSGPVLEFFNCGPCTDPSDVDVFTHNIVLEPSTGSGGPTQAETDMQNRLKAFEGLKGSDAGSSAGAGGNKDSGDPYGGGGGGKKKRGKRGDDDEEPKGGGGGALAALEESYSRMNLKQLQDLCIKMSLSKGGKKGDMVDRLVAHAEATGGAPNGGGGGGGGKKRR